MQVEPGILWTIGHSTRPWEEFVALLQENAVACVADVRRFAGSRRNPQFSPLAMGPALAEAGIEYLPMPDLGGRRDPAPDSPNGAWRVAAFRGYADYMATPEFVAARERLMAQARDARTAVMCAEAVWWRCHRRLVADDFTARGWQVLHIMAPGKTPAHELNENARMVGDVLRYPPPQEKLF
ncbi:MAG: DUF488 domain-containing protein [Pseudomonadota bacterium]|nr:DUF488 domain-containing protein [Pseudomonadota bacterium]